MNSRRAIMIGIAVLVALGVAGGVIAWAATSGGGKSSSRAAALVAGGGAPTWHIYIDGVDAGALRSVDGCALSSDIVTEKILNPTADPYAHKHLAGVKWDPCVIQFGVGMRSTLYQWIADTLQAKHTRHNVVLAPIAADNKTSAGFGYELRSALITGFSLPAFDAGSKDPLIFTADLAADQVIRARQKTSLLAVARPMKAPTVANFRLSVDGIDDAQYVTKIDPWTFQLNVVANAVGEGRDLSQEPGRPSFDDLNLQVPANHAASFETWAQSFIINGNNADANEKSARLDILAPDLKSTLFSLTFHGVGIARMQDLGSALNPTGMPATQREAFKLYDESASLTWKSNAALK